MLQSCGGFSSFLEYQVNTAPAHMQPAPTAQGVNLHLPFASDCLLSAGAGWVDNACKAALPEIWGGQVMGACISSPAPTQLISSVKHVDG